MARSMDASSWTITLIGSISAALTTVAFVPQAVRVWRLRDAREISLPTFAIFSLGLVGWVVYGTQVGSVPIIAANFVTLLIALAIVGLKIRFDRTSPGAAA
jgi:MtN3 and saliva related transmembrane protein